MMDKKTKRKPTGAAAMGPGPGRPKGCQNKVTKDVKEALEAAFQGMGGVGKLTTWAKKNPTEFYKLWAKMLPKDVKVSGALALEKLVAGEGLDGE